VRDQVTEFGRRIVLSVAAAASLFGSATRASAAGERGVVDVHTSLGYQSESSAGTGVVLTSSGEILTNNHVILGATSVRVTDLADGRTYPATVVGYDIANDLAVLMLRGASGLKTIGPAASAGLRVGQAVTAFGNAGGVGSTPSAARGRVTALGVSITATNENGSRERLQGMIETSAATMAGDSGGPLVDGAGRVVGINTAAVRNALGHTTAYAIPITRALSIASRIMSGHPTATSHIGPAPFLGLAVSSRAHGAGALVSVVLRGSPADRAGLAAGDLITAVAGRKISSLATLTKALLHSSPNDRVAVSWLDHSGADHHARIRLGTGPPQ
jgi:S1-C subfamily serine protease